MSKNLKISLAVVGVAVIALIVAALSSGGDDDEPTATSDAEVSERLVRDDSQRLSEGTTEATFVEFLDFECEACGAMYPIVEDLRAEYGDQMTFVVRYFPLHNNSEAASRAAEAAADQGEFEAMYQRLFETQAEWGESSESKEDVFFGYAEDLGLDMERFREVYDDPATIAKVQRDQADGEALGVSGTPTFFLNGEELELTSIEDLRAQVEAAIDSSGEATPSSAE